jgi:hypothetical protein
VLVLFAVVVFKLTLFVMPHHSKKRKHSDAEVDPVYDVPTLKEYAWQCLSSVLRRYSTVPLANKSGSDNAMQKFRCVMLSYLMVTAVCIFIHLSKIKDSSGVALACEADGC